MLDAQISRVIQQEMPSIPQHFHPLVDASRNRLKSNDFTHVNPMEIADFSPKPRNKTPSSVSLAGRNFEAEFLGGICF